MLRTSFLSLYLCAEFIARKLPSSHACTPPSEKKDFLQSDCFWGHYKRAKKTVACSHPGASSDTTHLLSRLALCYKLKETIWFVRYLKESRTKKNRRERTQKKRVKVAVKSPSKRCPLATALPCWNGFSGRRQRFYYSLKCSPMAFGRVWKSHFSMRSGGCAFSVLSSLLLHFQRDAAM